MLLRNRRPPKCRVSHTTPEESLKSSVDTCREHACFRKIPVSVKFVSAILGPEMAAPILWTPGKMRSFCRKTYVHKIPRFMGGFGGGGSADFIFMGARIFLNVKRSDPEND